MGGRRALPLPGAVVAACACVWLASLPLPSSCRVLQVATFDDAQLPIETFVPTTVMWNFTESDDQLRGSWQIDESDPRIDPAAYGGVAPEQVKLLYRSRSALLVTWSTGNSSTYVGEARVANLSLESSEVEVELPNGTLVLHSGEVDQYSYAYDAASVPGATNYSSGVLHRVLVRGLSPGTSYTYRVGSAAKGVWGSRGAFTMPGAGNAYPVSFAVLSDGGQTANSSETYRNLLQSDPHAVVWIGDLSEADARWSNGTADPRLSNATVADGAEDGLDPLTRYGSYQPRWDMWGRLVEPVTAAVPFVFAPGDHEIERQSDGTVFAAFAHRAPPPAAATGDPRYFSVDIGPVHWVFPSPYAPYDEGSDQLRWLVEDLDAVDRDDTPWVVVAQHAPVYSSYKAHYQEAECFRQALEPVFYDYGVDVVFAGHVHGYERSFPVFNYTLDPLGPVHVTLGTGGNAEQLDVVFADLPGHCPDPEDRRGMPSQPRYCYVEAYDGQFCAAAQPFWSAFREPAFGFGTFDVLNATTATLKWHRNQDQLPAVADSVYLTRRSTATGPQIAEMSGR